MGRVFALCMARGAPQAGCCREDGLESEAIGEAEVEGDLIDGAFVGTDHVVHFSEESQVMTEPVEGAEGQDGAHGDIAVGTVEGQRGATTNEELDGFAEMEGKLEEKLQGEELRFGLKEHARGDLYGEAVGDELALVDEGASPDPPVVFL